VLNKIAVYMKGILAFVSAAAVFLTANGFPAEGKWLAGAVATVMAFLVTVVPNAKKSE
jgi:hypothetical protein